MPQLSFLMALAIMPACLGFAGYTPCVDNDDAVPEYATALGVTEVSTCADVLTNGYCPSVPPDLLHHCCASCAGSVDDSVRLSRGSRGRGSGCSKDNQCSSGDCGDWTNHDLRCCPERNGVRRGRSDSNRWDQCGNLPSGSPCKNWDGSQCVGGRCHNWRCTADCDSHSDCAGGSGDKHSPVHSSVCEMSSLTSAHLALGTDWEECWRPDGGECSDLSWCVDEMCKSSLAQRGERCMNFGDSCDCAPGLFCLDTNHWGRIFGYYEFKCGSDPMSDASRAGTHGSKAADEPCSKHEDCGPGLECRQRGGIASHLCNEGGDMVGSATGRDGAGAATAGMTAILLGSAMDGCDTYCLPCRPDSVSAACPRPSCM